MRTLNKICMIILLGFLAQTTLSLYEKEIGLNDWKIENLGELVDWKFIENSNLVYTLSKTGLLTLFDIENQIIKWKKDLPSDETYHLRYLSRNLLIYSSKRVMMVNTASHIIYDLPVESLFAHEVSDAPVVVELFEFQNHVYSVLAKDYKVIIYKDYLQLATLEYTQQANEQSYTSIRPLEMIFDRKTSQLILLSIIGANSNKQVLTTFQIDVVNQSMEQKQSKEHDLTGLLGTARTHTFFALIFKDNVKFLSTTSIEKAQSVKDVVHVQTSILNDLVVLQDSKGNSKIRNLVTQKDQDISNDQNCLVKRSSESESVDTFGSEEVVIALHCQENVEIMTYKQGQYDKNYQPASYGQSAHGNIKQLFSTQSEYVLQFTDLSLIMVDKITKTVKWIREESLSQVKQVEILENEKVAIESDLEYVKNIKQKTTIESVIPRITARYIENAQYIIKSFNQFIQSLQSSAKSENKKSLTGIKSFQKTFIMLSDVGKIVAVSSVDGSVLWSNYNHGLVPNKILIRNIEQQSEHGSSQAQQIAAIYNDQIALLNPQTGTVERSYLLDAEKSMKREFILIQIQKSRQQYLLGISREDLESEVPLQVFPQGELTQSIMKEENVYFTYIDQSNNIINGYKLRSDLTAQKIWSLNLDKQNEKILKVQTQFQTQSEIEHLHFMPTAFSGENIIYKYLDSNIFAIATINAVNADMIIYLVNGVSGKIVYKYFEKNVRIDLPFDMVLSENLFILAFQRLAQNGLTHQEITVTELYSQRQEDNTKKLLLEYYKGDERLKQTSFTSFMNENPIIIQETYILPFSVKAIVLTQTQHHITGKNLVVITNKNLIYQIDYNLFTARRPHSDNLVLSQDEPKPSGDNQPIDLKNKDLPPYDAVIPVVTEKYLSYGIQLTDMKQVKSFATRFESTTQILAYGYDIFSTRLSPESNFDLLQEYFNYTLLFLFIGGLAVGAYIVSRIVKGKTNKNNFLLL